MGADGDEGEERIGAEADDGEVVGGFVDDEEHVGFGAGIGGSETHGGGRGANRNGLRDAAVEDVKRHEAAGGPVRDIHFGGVGGDDGAGGSGPEEHVVAHFVGPGVDGLQAVGVGRDDVKFAAIRLEEHLRGLAGEFEIGDEDGALQIDHGETVLRAAHDEGEGAVREDGDFVGLGDDRDGVEELQRARVVNGQGGGATINDKNVLAVGSKAGLHGFGEGVGAAVDGAGGAVDSDELVVGGGSGVDAVAFEGEIDGEGRRADGDASELIGAGVEHPEVTASIADAPDLVALRVFAQIGDARTNGNFGDGMEGDEVDDGNGAISGGGVGVHVEVGAKEGGTMLAENDDSCGDEKDDEKEIGAKVFGTRHGMRKG